MDVHSRWLVVKFRRDITTESTIRTLEDIFKEEGYPCKMITDNSTQLVSEEMTKYLEYSGIYHTCTSLYNSQANGMVERANRMVRGVVQMAIEKKGSVRKMVSDLVWAYRTTSNSSTGKVPFEMMRGRKANTRMCPSWMKNVMSGDLAKEQREKGSSGGQKQREKGSRIKTGDWVKVKPARISGGLTKFRGPYKVKEVHESFIVLENGEKWNTRRVALYGKEKDGCMV
ncbi:hypothetical protein NDU88_002406 [Pleurodeles waltl]|uniref:Integrase catalytic domain-containing protein n=1 Tax=Pleurodeles waltl TaxID=8319 RepID=A0AAV7WPT4_PLEWA|nr:hypothetical protein NDU88_002406 [Pleurodeles waltl]